MTAKGKYTKEKNYYEGSCQLLSKVMKVLRMVVKKALAFVSSNNLATL